MAIETVYCHVSNTTVTRVTDFEGRVTQLICPEYSQPSGYCRLKQEASSGGPLSQLLERVSEETLGDPSARCDLA